MPTQSDTLVNVAAHLPAMARRTPHVLAVVFPEGRDHRGRVSYTHYTFAQLDQESRWIAAGLEAHGIRRGTRTVLMVNPSLDFFALTFALFKVGAVPILIDPGLGARNLGRCLSEAEPAAFVGTRKAHAARQILGWGRRTIKMRVTVGPGIPGGGVNLAALRRVGQLSGSAYEIAPTRPEEIAAILFTSGSTGPPKGAVYTHGNFAAQVDAIRRLYGIEPGEIDLPTFPLFALFDPALGMTAIIPDMDASRPARVDPQKIVEAIENFGVTNMFGSPALIDRVGRYGVAHDIRFPTLRRVLSAGAPVSAATVERFASLLSPEAEIHTPYGATEALPVTSISSHEILAETRRETEHGRGVCVGRPVDGVDVEVLTLTDAPIERWSPELRAAPGTIGEIAVRGPMVTREYDNRPAATRDAKIRAPASNGEVLHRMGDVGYFDPEGRLWFCGRKSQRVRCGAKTHFTTPTEGIFNSHPAVYRSALVGVRRSGETAPVICVELEKRNISTEEHEKIRRELLELATAHDVTRDIRTILFHESFPVDIRHNAKIFREKLAVWAEKKVR